MTGIDLVSIVDAVRVAFLGASLGAPLIAALIAALVLWDLQGGKG